MRSSKIERVAGGSSRLAAPPLVTSLPSFSGDQMLQEDSVKNPELSTASALSLSTILLLSSWYFFRLPDQCSVLLTLNSEKNRSVSVCARLNAFTEIDGVTKVALSSCRPAKICCRARVSEGTSPAVYAVPVPPAAAMALR